MASAPLLCETKKKMTEKIEKKEKKGPRKHFYRDPGNIFTAYETTCTGAYESIRVGGHICGPPFGNIVPPP